MVELNNEVVVRKDYTVLTTYLMDNFSIFESFKEIHVRSRSFVSLKVSLDEQIQQR